MRAFTRNALAAGLLVVLLEARADPAEAKDQPLVRAYYALVNLCLDRALSDKQRIVAFANANRSLMVHCDCLAQAMMGHLAPPQWPDVFNGDLPKSAEADWLGILWC